MHTNLFFIRKKFHLEFLNMPFHLPMVVGEKILFIGRSLAMIRSSGLDEHGENYNGPAFHIILFNFFNGLFIILENVFLFFVL